MVTLETPEAFATAEIPPWPSDCASAAATKRLLRSLSAGISALNFSLRFAIFTHELYRQLTQLFFNGP